MSKKDDEINRQLIFNSGGANPEDYLTPKQLQRYNENRERFIDIDVDLAMNEEKEEVVPTYESNRQKLQQSRNLDPNRFQSQLETIQKYTPDLSDPKEASEFFTDLAVDAGILGRTFGEDFPQGVGYVIGRRLTKNPSLKKNIEDSIGLSVEPAQQLPEDSVSSGLNIIKQMQEVFSGRLFGVTGGNFPTSSGFIPPTPKQVYDTKQKLMTNQLADASGRLNIWNYFKNKKGRSNWGRLMAKEVQTLPHTRESWTRIKNELQNDFLSIYPESFLKTIKYKNAKGRLVPLGKDSIEVEHIFTLQQSMPIFANVEWGGDVWQEISRRILSRQFALGDTRQNLIAVPEHIHRIKSQYFNKMAGIDGRKFFTDDVINQMTTDTNFRNAKIDEWLDEVEKGKKIIDDGLTIWETLYKGKPIPQMPEELVEKLASIDLDNADIEKVIPQIFKDFEAEGFTTDAWNVKELKAQQLKIDAKDVEATGKIINKYIKANPKKYNKPYPFGMRDQDLRDAAENAWVWMRKNKLKFEGQIQTSIFDAENKEKWIKFTMKSILNQSKRNFK